MAHSGELDHKHHELICEELDKKIAKLKHNLSIEPLSLEQIIKESSLEKIFGENAAQESVKDQNFIFVEPAHVIDKENNSLSVTSALMKKESAKVATNNKIYLITKGAVYEHLVKDFDLDNIDQNFKKNNTMIKR